MSRVVFPIIYIPDPTKGRPVFKGKVYFGLPDLDPTIAANQKQVYYIQENGDLVAAGQPISTSAGGVPVYNGSPVTLDISGEYSMTVLDQGLLQVYNIPKTDSSGDGGSSIITYAENPQTLLAGQLIINFPGITVSRANIFVGKNSGDRGKLFKGADYTVTGGSQITLTSSFSAGTEVIATSSELSGKTDFVKKFLTLEVAVADPSLTLGDAINLSGITKTGQGSSMWDVVLLSTVTANSKNIIAWGNNNGNASDMALVLRKILYIDAAAWGVTDVDSTLELTNISEQNDGGIIRFPAGKFLGKFTSTNNFGLGMQGDGDISTYLLTASASDSAFTVPATKQLRSTSIKSMAFYQQGFEGGTIGTGKGIDLTNAVTTVNAHFEDISLNWFGVGYESSSNAFSNQLDNVRANFCGESFRFSGTGQLINHTLNNCYSSQPSVNGLFMSGCKNFVFNGYNSGSAGAPHVNVAGGSFGIIFNSPNFEQDLGTLAVGSEAIRCQSDSETTFNYPTFASPKSVDSTAYLFRVKDTAVVYINNPKIISPDSNIQHIFAEDNAVIYLSDPKNVIDDSKVTLVGNSRLIRVDRVDISGFTAFGRLTAHAAGANILTGLSTVPVDYDVAIDFATTGDAVIAVEAQVTALGTGTLKVRYLNIATGAESFLPYNIIWKAR